MQTLGFVWQMTLGTLLTSDDAIAQAGALFNTVLALGCLSTPFVFIWAMLPRRWRGKPPVRLDPHAVALDRELQRYI